MDEDVFIRADVLYRAKRRIMDALKEIPHGQRWYVCSLAIRELNEEELERMARRFRG